MKNRTYNAVSVKDIDLDQLALPERVAVGIDIAKKVLFAVLMSTEEEILAVLKWDHLSESRRVVRWLSAQRTVRGVAMEPSGTYGDALRVCLEQAGLEVYRVHPKKVKDAREIYDGVPSSHDAKAAAIIAWLHLLGRSERWQPGSQREREMKAAIGLLSLHERSFVQAQNILESRLARYWPEATRLLELDSVALLELLQRFGGPAQVAAAPEEAASRLRRVGRSQLKEAKIQKLLKSARETLGVPMIEAECWVLRELAGEARHRQQAVQGVKKRLEALSLRTTPSLLLAGQVGVITAAVLVSELGPLEGYAHPGSLLKAAGLNLKEVSSGRKQGQLSMTKRGSSRLRHYLYLAVLRWIQKDPWARAWYDKKVQRDGGKIKLKAIVALMRKLMRGLWWVARGEPFDSTKLFDTRRLEVAA